MNAPPYHSVPRQILDEGFVGDIRSRLVRLVPESAFALVLIRNFLAFRLPSDGNEARLTWREIVEGKSSIWSGIMEDMKELIRG